MADPRGINPQAVYSNRHSVMVSDMVRLVFIDERQATGRVAVTESIVSEVVISREDAMIIANEIMAVLGTQPPIVEANPVLGNGTFQPRRTV